MSQTNCRELALSHGADPRLPPSNPHHSRPVHELEAEVDGLYWDLVGDPEPNANDIEVDQANDASTTFYPDGTPFPSLPSRTSALPCDVDGAFLPRSDGGPLPPPILNLVPSPPPSPLDTLTPLDAAIAHWGSVQRFRWAHLYLQQLKLSASQADVLLKETHADFGRAPFTTLAEIHRLVDSDPSRTADWQSYDLELEPDKFTPSPHYDFERAPLKVWFRDPELVIRALLRDPSKIGHQSHLPQQDYDEQGGRVYSEFQTGDRAWQLQDDLPQGATLVPFLLASDKTMLSQHIGDKDGYPVYINVATNAIRSRHTDWILIALIPDVKTPTGKTANMAARAAHHTRRVFHEVVRRLIAPLIAAAQRGTVCIDAAGVRRVCFFRLVGHVADTPERSQIASCMMNVCPSCDSGLSELSVLRQLVGGQHDGRPLPLHRHPKLRVAYASAKPVVFRTHAESQAVRNTGSIKAINALGLHAPRPYADGFPACDPHHLVLPDLLHQKKWMHDTLFMNWIVGRAKERGPSVNSLSSKLNRWLACVPPFGAIRDFPTGWEWSKQWTGECTKSMLKLLVPAVYNMDKSDKIGVGAVCALTSFFFEIDRHSQNDRTLAMADSLFADWDRLRPVYSKHVSATIGYNHLRLHMMQHYTSSVRELGVLPGTCTSAAENAHIANLKVHYKATNHLNVEAQILIRVQRESTFGNTLKIFQAAGLIPTQETRKERSQSRHGSRVGVELSSIRPKLRSVAEVEREEHLPGLADAVTEYIKIATEMARSRNLAATGRIKPFITLYRSAWATYHQPHDHSAPLVFDHIIANPRWCQRDKERTTNPNYATVALGSEDPFAPDAGAESSEFARVKLFFTISEYGQDRSFAWVDFFDRVGDRPHEYTKLWRLKWRMKMVNGIEVRVSGMVPAGRIKRLVHLVMDVPGDELPIGCTRFNSLDLVRKWFLNAYGNRVAFDSDF